MQWHRLIIAVAALWGVSSELCVEVSAQSAARWLGQKTKEFSLNFGMMMERIADANMKFGTGGREALVAARAGRLKAEIDLHKVRKRAK